MGSMVRMFFFVAVDVSNKWATKEKGILGCWWFNLFES
jgi:hypothetical protein